MTDYSELPPALRAAAYRNLAGDARRESSILPNGPLRESYLLKAIEWERLAAEAEASIKDSKPAS